MQEEVENRAVTLIISGSKLTGRVLKAAFQKYLAHQNAKKQKLEAAKEVKPQGKQTVKDLVGQNAGVANIEITDKNIRSFDRVARKYGVDYAVKKDRTVKYFFCFLNLPKKILLRSPPCRHSGHLLSGNDLHITWHDLHGGLYDLKRTI